MIFVKVCLIRDWIHTVFEHVIGDNWFPQTSYNHVIWHKYVTNVLPPGFWNHCPHLRPTASSCKWQSNHSTHYRQLLPPFVGCELPAFSHADDNSTQNLGHVFHCIALFAMCASGWKLVFFSKNPWDCLLPWQHDFHIPPLYSVVLSIHKDERSQFKL